MDTKRIWIDIDNSPHVLFFKPIVRRLRETGHEVVITARACAQTQDLLDLHQMNFVPIGRHYGKRLLSKIIGMGIRSVQLCHFAFQRNIDLALSHGSRSLVWTSFLMRIPCMTLYDYEYVFTGLFNKFSTKVLVPEVIPDEILLSIGLDLKKTARYPGYKEEVYLGDLKPDPEIYSRLGIERDKILVTFRPPATQAHYHHPLSEELFTAALEYVLNHRDAVAVVLPRSQDQIRQLSTIQAAHDNLHVLDKPVDGLNLLWHSDVVISGGGTMNREAALLGIPVYSVFTGKQGTVDKTLAEQGKLNFLSSLDDIEGVILRKRNPHLSPPLSNSRVIEFILHEIQAAV